MVFNFATLKYTLRQTAIFFSWVPVLYVINEHVAYVGIVEGSSMKPTLNPESNGTKLDHVLLWKWGCKNINNLHLNDVIFLRSPINPETIYVKRIKAKQGDLVVPRYPDTRSRVLIPVNHLWVEGDNLHSIDSNTYGPVSTGLVLGKATYIIWPWKRFGSIATGGRECRKAYLERQLPPEMSRLAEVEEKKSEWTSLTIFDKSICCIFKSINNNKSRVKNGRCLLYKKNVDI